MERKMEREELRQGLLKIIEFLETEVKSYNKSLQRYIELIRNYKKVYIFGAGIYGINAATILKEMLPDKEYFFIDNDKRKQGELLYHNICCFGTEKLKECNREDSIIIIASNYARNEIYSTLKSGKLSLNGVNIDNVIILKDFGFLFCKMDYEDRLQNEIWNEYIKHKEEILKVFDLLSDKESCYVFYKIFVNRIMLKDTFCEIYTPNQYFIPEICECLGKNEVFLDCGSYIGETLESFKNYTKNKFLKAYEFELDKKNYKKLSENPVVDDARVSLLNMGVGNKNEAIEYAQFDNRGGSCGFAFAGHDVKIGAHLEKSEIKTVDTLINDGVIKEKITFVKMDIEGAEMQALEGMENMLRRDRPKLAICLYHRPQDMWEIPLYLYKIMPEYQFLIRHHDFEDNETVLYVFNK